MKKLTAEIYKPSYGDCSNHGLSHMFDEVVCYWLDKGEKREDLKDVEENAVIFIPRIIFEQSCPIFEPIQPVKAGNVGYMMGGCFISSSDSRFSEFCNQQTVPLHDRQETTEQYNMYD